MQRSLLYGIDALKKLFPINSKANLNNSKERFLFSRKDTLKKF